MRIPDKTLQAVKLTVCLALLAGAMMLLCTQGCARLGMRGVVSTDNRLLDAVAVVWASYGRTDAPPKVRLVTGDALSCIDEKSGTPGFPVLLVSGWACRNGFTLSAWEVSVSWTGWPWHQTSLAHELMHAALARRFILDPQHDREEWDLLVPAANVQLEARGM